ncbi:MAG: CPBP family intramembrane glutamic endopeptidase [Candidatus Bathyarchaeia archaeon]
MSLKMLLLCLFLSAVILANVYAILSSILPQAREGAQGAYITKIEYPEVTFSGNNVTLSLIVHNKNCTNEGEDSGTFFFNFYIDNEFWWSEYNSTPYKTWKCNVQTSVMCTYTIPNWSTIKPIHHNIKVELEWFDGSESHLQDAISFPLRIAVSASFADMLILSYLAIYVIMLLLIIFYIMVAGRLGILIPQKEEESSSHLNKENSFSKLTYKSLIFLCAFIIISWQLLNVTFNMFKIPEGISRHASSLTQTFYLALLIIIARRKNLQTDGWKHLWPPKIHKHFLVYTALALIYSITLIFVSGALKSYYIYPSIYMNEVLSLSLLAFIRSVAGETIFRGFVQSALKKERGFAFALLTGSLMYSLYSFPLLSLDVYNLFRGIISFFTLGIFLGILFNRTETLLSTTIFFFAISLFSGITPVKAQITEFESLIFHFAALGLSLAFLYIFTASEAEEIEEEYYY